MRGRLVVDLCILDGAEFLYFTCVWETWENGIDGSSASPRYPNNAFHILVGSVRIVHTGNSDIRGAAIFYGT